MDKAFYWIGVGTVVLFGAALHVATVWVVCSMVVQMMLKA
jgi:hypothetical protein